MPGVNNSNPIYPYLPQYPGGPTQWPLPPGQSLQDILNTHLAQQAGQNQGLQEGSAARSAYETEFAPGTQAFTDRNAQLGLEAQQHANQEQQQAQNSALAQ